MSYHLRYFFVFFEKKKLTIIQNNVTLDIHTFRTTTTRRLHFYVALICSTFFLFKEHLPVHSYIMNVKILFFLWQNWQKVTNFFVQVLFFTTFSYIKLTGRCWGRLWWLLVDDCRWERFTCWWINVAHAYCRAFHYTYINVNFIPVVKTITN